MPNTRPLGTSEKEEMTDVMDVPKVESGVEHFLVCFWSKTEAL